MKSLIQLLLSLLLLVYSANALMAQVEILTEHDNKYREIRRDNKVASATIHKYRGQETTPYHTYVYNYDANGYILSCNEFWRDTERFEASEKYEYDRNNRLVKIKKVQLVFPLKDKNVKVCSETETESIMSIEIADPTPLREETVFIEFAYSEKGQKIKETKLNATGDTLFYIGYMYDEKGNLVKETHHEFNPSTSWERVYAYNEANELIRFAQLNSSGKEIITTDYINENGVVKSYKTYVRGKLKHDVVYHYAENGDFLYNNLKYEHYTYNDKHLPISMEKIDPDGTPQGKDVYEYTFR